MPNYSFKTLPVLNNGDTLENANLTRIDPRTEIYSGITGLTFRNCNLTNCTLPADAVIERCLQTHVDFCSNLHPELASQGLASCTVTCSHLVSTDLVQVDGVTVETIYHYEDAWIGRT